MNNISFKDECPVCGGLPEFYTIAQDLEYYTNNNFYTYLKCKNCNSLFISKPPVDELDIIYPKNYYSFSEKSNSFIYKIKDFIEVLMFKRITKKLKGKNLSVLDIGGGTGWLINTLKKADNRFNDCNIVDIDQKAKDIAEKNGYNFYLGKVEDIEFEKKFDLILMLNLIEHVVDPLLILDKAKQLLKDNGLILIKTPNVSSLDSYMFKNKNWGGLHTPRHFILFNEKSFRLLADKAGLNVNSLKYTQGAPQWTTSIMGLLSKYKIIKINKEISMPEHSIYKYLSIIFATLDFIISIFTKTSQMFIILSK